MVDVKKMPRASKGILTTILILLSGYFALHMIFTTMTTPRPIGSARVPKVMLEKPFMIHQMNGVQATANALANKEKVLILTPMATFYPEYWANLLKLSYPHSLIELGFIVPNNAKGDETLENLNAAIKQVQLSSDSSMPFAQVTVLRQDTASPESQNEADRHAMSVQKERRKYMSLARNSLLFTAIHSDTSWVFWLDADVVETPATILQDMTAHNRDVIVANCWQRYTEKGESKKRPYDYNSWIDSPGAQDIASKMDPDDVLLEGYAEMATYRTLMAHHYSEGGDITQEMELDGVGATALLVKADVHRDGAMFPPFSFYHLIESEGFAKMVKRLGYKVFGLPNYLVFHFNE